MENIRENIANNKYAAKKEYVRGQYYKDGYVFDEDKSVSWNKKEVNKRNEEVAKARREYRESVDDAIRMFKEDVVDMLVEDGNMPVEMAETVYTRAWQESHSSGLVEVLEEAMDLGSFVATILTHAEK